MLPGLLALLACQLVGEVLVRLLGVDFPGAVVGMVLFLVVLRVRRPAPSSGLVRAPTMLLGYLQLLFVPAGVGIVVILGEIGRDAGPIAAGLWVSWLLGFVATALLAQQLVARVRRR